MISMSPWVFPPIRVRRWSRRATSWKTIADTDTCVLEQYHWPKTSQKNSQNTPAPCFRIITKCTPHLKVFQSRDREETYEALYFLRDEILPCLEGRPTSAKIASLLKNIAPNQPNSSTLAEQALQPSSNRASPTGDLDVEDTNGSLSYPISDGPDGDDPPEPFPSKRWTLENDSPTAGRMKPTDADQSTSTKPTDNGHLKSAPRYRPLKRWRLSKQSSAGAASSGPGALEDSDDADYGDSSESSWEDLNATPPIQQDAYPTPRFPTWLAWLETIQNNSDGATQKWLNMPLILLNLLIYPEPAATGSRPRIQEMREKHLVRQRRRVLAFLTLYCVIIRWCSIDAFMIIMAITNAALLYLMKNSKRINVNLAKRKVRRQVGWAKTWAGGFLTRRRVGPNHAANDEASEAPRIDTRPTQNAISTPASATEGQGSQVGSQSSEKASSMPDPSSSKDVNAPLSQSGGTQVVQTQGPRRKRLLGLARRSQSATTGPGQTSGPLLPNSPHPDANPTPRLRNSSASSPPAFGPQQAVVPNGTAWNLSTSQAAPTSQEERSLFNRRKKSVETPHISSSTPASSSATAASRRISNPLSSSHQSQVQDMLLDASRLGSVLEHSHSSGNWSLPPSYREFETS